MFMIVFLINENSSAKNVKFEVSCIANSKCLNKVFRDLKHKKNLDFGIFSVRQKENSESEGRSLKSLWNLMKNSLIRVPFGDYALDFQKSSKYEDFFEVLLSKAMEGDLTKIKIKIYIKKLLGRWKSVKSEK